MGLLDQVPLFAGIGADALGRLEARLERQRFVAGEVILRVGSESAALYGVISGAVRVELDAERGKRLLLVAPQCFGELSALTGDPVSATIVAHRDTEAWMLRADDLIAELDQEGRFFRNLSAMLGRRLRHRTRPQRPGHTRVLLMPVADPRDARLAGPLYAGIAHYLPGSTLIDLRTHAPADALRALREASAAAIGETAVLLLAGRDTARTIASALRPGDIVLERDAEIPAGQAECLRWQWRADARPSADAEWCYALDADRIDSAPSPQPARPASAALDRLVRRLCGREIGLAMSVGAAAGLAHLGLLEVLEDEGLPVDFLCGSSMGGAVALAYARFGRVRAAIDALTRLSADFARDRGFSFMPRSSLVSADRMVHLTNELFGDASFADLGLPTAVVAADLVAARRVVLDRGPVAPAARATAAIPGMFAPVRLGHSLLVDGGVVTRVPADLLVARGCGCKLASLVHPDDPQRRDLAAAADDLESRLEQPLGLRLVLGGAWRLLGWWDSATQAERADVALRIPTPPMEGFNFADGAMFVECGRAAARRQIGAIRAAVQSALEPGVP